MPGIAIGNCIPFNRGGINWSSYWTKQLSRNNDIVENGGYAAIATINYNNGSINGWRSFLNKSNIHRIRQNGIITEVSFAVSIGNMTSVYIDVWRKDGITYDSKAHQNVFSLITVNPGVNRITLPTQLSVVKGDFLGISCQGTVTGSQTNFPAIAGSGDMFYVNSEASGDDYNWDARSTINNIYLPIKSYGIAPLTVLIGDSIMAGHPTNYSFIENSVTTDITCQVDVLLEIINPKYIAQNMGIGSQTSTQIAARFAADVVALKPKIVIINGGVNDIAGGSITKATFIANYTAMLNACLTNDILPVICKILPWTNGTNEQMQTRDEWMTDLEALVKSATYNGAVWVDFDTAMGKNRVSGDAGNLWDLQTDPDYNNDGVHPTALGYAKMAEVIDAAITAKGYVLV